MRAQIPCLVLHPFLSPIWSASTSAKLAGKLLLSPALSCPLAGDCERLPLAFARPSWQSCARLHEERTLQTSEIIRHRQIVGNRFGCTKHALGKQDLATPKTQAYEINHPNENINDKVRAPKTQKQPNQW